MMTQFSDIYGALEMSWQKVWTELRMCTHTHIYICIHPSCYAEYFFVNFIISLSHIIVWFIGFHLNGFRCIWFLCDRFRIDYKAHWLEVPVLVVRHACHPSRRDRRNTQWMKILSNTMNLKSFLSDKCWWDIPLGHLELQISKTLWKLW